MLEDIPSVVRRKWLCSSAALQGGRCRAKARRYLPGQSRLNAKKCKTHYTSDKELADEIARLIRELEAQPPSDARNGCTIKSVVRLGKPYWEIIQLATESQTDLIVMGVRGRGALDIAVFGSTTRLVLQLGPCPLLSVPV